MCPPSNAGIGRRLIIPMSKLIVPMKRRNVDRPVCRVASLKRAISNGPEVAFNDSWPRINFEMKMRFSKT